MWVKGISSHLILALYSQLAIALYTQMPQSEPHDQEQEEKHDTGILGTLYLIPPDEQIHGVSWVGNWGQGDGKERCSKD